MTIGFCINSRYGVCFRVKIVLRPNVKIRNTKMQFAVLGYNNTKNIGDSIQSVAVLQHVDQDYIVIDRDNLKEYDGVSCVVVMNGWFSHQPQNWPPSNKIKPIFFGFHITPVAADSYKYHKEYFKSYEPIGCRDLGTAETLRSWGVDAYVSGCATMTFPERATVPVEPRDIVVDIDPFLFCRNDRRRVLSLTHESHIDYTPDTVRNQVASSLLKFYKDNAGSIVTSRIHCAMPCYAMGIPVVYCGIQEYRTKLIHDIGVPSVDFPKFWHQGLRLPKYKRLDFSVLPFVKPDYDEKKNMIARNLRGLLLSYGIKLKAWTSKEYV